MSEFWTEDGDWMSLIGSRRPRSGREAITAVLVQEEGVWRIATSRVARIERIPPQ